MSDEMSSKNSNNSDIEVIGPEDLEESPPPQDTTESGSEAAGDTAEAAPETKEVIQKKSDLSERPASQGREKKRPFVRPANF